jgi:hypothetical protein
MAAVAGTLGEERCYKQISLTFAFFGHSEDFLSVEPC